MSVKIQSSPEKHCVLITLVKINKTMLQLTISEKIESSSTMERSKLRKLR